ncbi:hypothetical protein DH2020_035741 [Rehmannia glutinosa]|uniref:DIRP domain-containing protein n=1 Tax=Rehmannia glutinosa TaxID=99300 RepID=A0ABR0V6P4_REHGL
MNCVCVGEEMSHVYECGELVLVLSLADNGARKKVASAVRNRSSEMVEALYTMNRAYLSLPHGTASAAGLIAMMTDHYSNLAGSDSDQESNDGVGSSRKTQKRARGKVQSTTSKASDEQFVSHSPTIGSSYGCLSLLKKKRSGGSRPRPVGKRTPRFPISFSYENISGDKLFSPTRQGLKLKANADDDEVAHEIAIALAEASQRGGSPQVSGTPNRRAESVMSSPFKHAQRKHSVAEMANTKLLAADTDEEDLEGSTEADTGELSRYKPMESVSIGTTRQKGRKLEGEKIEVDNNYESHLDDTKEECSGTEEGQRSGTTRGKFDVEVNNTKISRSSMQSQRKKSKKVLFGKDEEPAFDALQTLADLSLMMPIENEDESRVQFKDEPDDHVDESVPLEALPANQPREKRKSSGIRMKGYLVSSSGAGSAKYQNLEKIQKIEDHPDIHLSESLGIEVPENSSSADIRKEGSDSAQSAVQVPVVNQVSLPTKEKLSNCLLNQRLRRWCTYEWFYSAIDYPWFAKREFVEYLRKAWQCINVSSNVKAALGKPRRFSEQFLKEEKEKLNQYRDSVRKHYTELREGIREGLPTRPREAFISRTAGHCHSPEKQGRLMMEDIDCMPLNPFETMPALLGRHTVSVDKFFENINELKINGHAKEYIKLSSGDNLDNNDGISQLSSLANPAKEIELLLVVASANANAQTRIGLSDTATYHLTSNSQPSTLAQLQAKEADIQALAELTRALDKKDGDRSPLKGSEPFKKQYAAVLVQLNEANEQVTSALHCLRERNTYQGKFLVTSPRPVTHLADPGGTLSSAITSLKSREDTIEKIEEAIDYVNDQLPSDDSGMSMTLDPKTANASEIEAQIPSELITKCVATLLMIQKCTERQFPPSEVAQILDSDVTSLQPRSTQNLPVYTEIQKSVGIIKNQILALIPT